MLNLVSAEKTLGDKAYTPSDMFKTLDNVIFSKKVLNTYERLLQKVYVISFCDLYTGANAVSRMGIEATPTSNPKILQNLRLLHFIR